MLKGQKGITLVALVITIIVLLILASVTISLTLGENGIFQTAKNASKNYANASRDELYGINAYLNEAQNVIDDLNRD